MEPDEWRNRVGVLIERGRTAKGLTKRKAARAAGFDEAVWRQIEEGYRLIQGNRVPANPRDENLEAAARVVGLDPAAVFEAAGRPFDRAPIEISASGVDLDELAREDPEQYEAIMDLARLALDRARARRRS